ncbi:MAG: rhodanese-like domain-containing protein [Elusimicrobia bacterium]|nr:rhodanese-like domain-containing protein [Elusimicrobiota bacterium]
MSVKLKLVNPKKARRFFARKLAFTTGPVELWSWIQERANIVIVDVRAPADYARGHIPGAVNLPKESWQKPAGLRKGRVNVVYCYSQVCHLAAAAARELAEAGFPVMELEGGFQTWKDHEGLIEKESARKHPAKKASAKKASRTRRQEEPAPQPEAAPAESEPSPVS